MRKVTKGIRGSAITEEDGMDWVNFELLPVLKEFLGNFNAAAGGVVEVTEDTVLDGEASLILSNGSSTLDHTLPAADKHVRVYTFKVIDSGGFGCDVYPASGDTLEGGAVIGTLRAQFDYVSLRPDGKNTWYVIAGS